MNGNYPHLFEPLTVRNITYKNRIFASPVAAPEINDDGTMPDYHVLQYLRKAWGGCAQVALGEIPVDMVYANREHKYWMDHIDYTDFNSPYRKAFSDYAKAIHDAGAVASIQISHAGESKFPDPGDQNPIGPTGYTTAKGIQVTEMDEALMDFTCRSFANCALFLKEAGFDSVQIHAGHGWLIHQFLSPLFNKRTDAYGGAIENRAKFPARIFRAVREAVGDDMIIEARVSGADFVPGGMQVEEVARFCQLIQEDVDLIHVSAGLYRDPARSGTFSSIFHPHGLNVENAAVIKQAVHIPVIVVGGLNNPAYCDKIIADGKVDVVAFGRQMFADPEFANKAAAGKTYEINKCLRCFNCFPGPMEDNAPPPMPPMGEGEENPFQYGPKCTINPLSGTPIIFEKLPKKGIGKKLLVVGGGIGGMSAAVYGADLGYQVTLIEKADHLGGLICFADHDCHKTDIAQLNADFQQRIAVRDIAVQLSTPASKQLIDRLKPDAILCAVGSSPVKAPIPGIDGSNVLQALDAYYAPERVGKRVVMIGGGLVGCEEGLNLAASGKEVTIIEMRDELAPDSYRLHRVMLMEELKAHTKTYTGYRCSAITAEGVLATAADGTEKLFPADTVIYAMGMRANSNVAASIQEMAGDIPFASIGDCVKAGKIIEAMTGAFKALQSF